MHYGNMLTLSDKKSWTTCLPACFCMKFFFKIFAQTILRFFLSAAECNTRNISEVLSILDFYCHLLLDSPCDIMPGLGATFIKKGTIHVNVAVTGCSSWWTLTKKVSVNVFHHIRQNLLQTDRIFLKVSCLNVLFTNFTTRLPEMIILLDAERHWVLCADLFKTLGKFEIGK